VTETPPLALRRARLIALAEVQRQRLLADIEPWRKPLALADRGIAAARFVGNHPAWMVGTAVAPMAFRTRARGTWFRRGLAAFQIVRGLRNRHSQG
jgi:hypothetical protein